MGKLCWQPTTVAWTLCNSFHILRKEWTHTHARHHLLTFCFVVKCTVMPSQHGITPLWTEGGEWCNVHLHFITLGNELMCTNQATQPSPLVQEEITECNNAHLWVDYVKCASQNLGKQNTFHGSSTSSLACSFGVKVSLRRRCFRKCWVQFLGQFESAPTVVPSGGSHCKGFRCPF